MRRFLYITPYFPPQTRVGALRPLKFARHLPAQGWQPVVLADLGRSDSVDRALEALVPAETPVVFDYSAGAAANRRALDGRAAGPPAEPGGDEGREQRATTPKPAPRGSALGASIGRWIDKRVNPEWVPLGEHSVDIPHATRAALKLLERYPECEAIVVNADPYAALIVGRRVADASGLPLIGDLRDPWAPCDLRRPTRPALQRAAVDRMEHWVIEGCARYVLNTETARDAYLRTFPDVPPERFEVIRNHGDRALISAGTHAPGDRFTAVFMGNFRRHVEGDELVEALARLPGLGVPEDEFELVVTGRVPVELRELAEARGVSRLLRDAPFVPYREVGTYLQTADLLVSLSHDSAQRIPAKIYDYATTDRPILIVADNPELTRIAAQLGGATVAPRSDVGAIAEALAAAWRAGRGRSVDRRDAGLDSTSASAKLARLLESVGRPR